MMLQMGIWSGAFYLGLGDLCVHGVFGFEDFLNLLLRTSKETRKHT